MRENGTSHMCLMITEHPTKLDLLIDMQCIESPGEFIRPVAEHRSRSNDEERTPDALLLHSDVARQSTSISPVKQTKEALSQKHDSSIHAAGKLTSGLTFTNGPLQASPVQTATPVAEGFGSGLILNSWLQATLTSARCARKFIAWMVFPKPISSARMPFRP